MGSWQDYRIYPPNPPNEGILFVDHSQNDRSGHVGHAMVEYEPGKLLAFYANCSNDDKGHSAVGWMEYKRSLDGGSTWSEGAVLQHTKDILERSGRQRSAFAEKCVRTDSGALILFFLNCDISQGAIWEPYWIPTYTRSGDGGESWETVRELGEYRGRVYDAIHRHGRVYALHFCNDATIDFVGKKPEHVYRLYASDDEGQSFQLLADIPFQCMEHGYGTMEFLDDHRLIVYIYNNDDEYNLTYLISEDRGLHWSAPQSTAHFAKKIRNPQLIRYGAGFFLHGRSGSWGEMDEHFVLYYSDDGIHWDEGRYLALSKDNGQGAYSNSIVVGALDAAAPKRLLIQASHAYKLDQDNVLHWWIDKA